MSKVLPLNSRTKHRYGCALVVLLLAISLTGSLATRIFHDSFTTSTSAQAAASQGMRQHLDQDATQWVAPVPTFTALEATSFYPRFAPAGPPLASVLLDENLYNRPPPSC